MSARAGIPYNIRRYILRNLHCFIPHCIKKFRIRMIITEFCRVVFNTVSLTDRSPGKGAWGTMRQAIPQCPALSGFGSATFGTMEFGSSCFWLSIKTKVLL